MATQGYFKFSDYVVFIGTVFISLGIGVFYAIWDRRRNTPKDYFLAGGQSRVLPVTLSFVVTFQSSLMVLGFPAEVYMYGMKYCYSIVGIVLSYIFAMFTFVPVIHPLHITSVYKYFEMRYHDNTIRYLTMGVGALFTLFYMGSVTYGTCIALEVVMGVPYWGTIILYTMVTAVYTSIGGMKAVIWSDVFQLLIMITGITAVLTRSTIKAGGMASVWNSSSARLDMNDFRLDPTIRYQFWNASIGTFVHFLYVCFSQSGVQRIKSVPTIKSAKQMFLFSAWLYALIVIMASYQGVTIFALYVTEGCDPLESGRMKNVNELVPLAVLDLFHDLPGLAGLFIAALSSAALSTMSSCLSSLSAIIYEDFLKEKYPHLGESKATNISKVFVLVCSVFALLMSIMISQLPGTVAVIFQGFMSCLDGPTCAIFILSLIYRRATTKGVFVGAICGMAVSLWLMLGKTFYPIPPYPMLPAGPTDSCSATGKLSISNLTLFTESMIHNVTSQTLYAQHMSIETTTVPYDTEQNGLSFLEKLYSISYVFLPFVSFTISMTIGMLVSVFTVPPQNIDERCMFSCKRHIWHRWETCSSEESERGTNERIEETRELVTYNA